MNNMAWLPTPSNQIQKIVGISMNYVPTPLSQFLTPLVQGVFSSSFPSAKSVYITDQTRSNPSTTVDHMSNYPTPTNLSEAVEIISKLENNLAKANYRIAHLIKQLDILDGSDPSLRNFKSPESLPEPLELPKKKVVPVDSSTSSAPSTSIKSSKTNKNNSKNKGQPNQPNKNNTPLPPMNRVNLIVGTIVDVTTIPESEGLYLEQIDCGDPDGPRQILSNLRSHKTIDQMKGQRLVVVANLKPRKFCQKYMSHGMVLCGSNSDTVDFVVPPPSAPNGSRVYVEGYNEGTPDAKLNPKKKIFEKVAADLKTDPTGKPLYMDIPLKTDHGECTCTILNGEIH